MKYYKIPNNFKDSGYILNGQVAVRNAIDAVIMGLLGVLLASFMPVKGTSAISVYILFAGLLGMAGLVGVKGVPLSTFLLDFIGWQKRRKKPYLYNNHGESFSQSAADLALQAPQLRDMIANAIDGVKARFASGEKVYVEGKTFEFALDPELEALRFAEQEKAEKEKLNEQPKTPPPQKPAEQTPATQPGNHTLDAESIVGQIVLN